MLLNFIIKLLGVTIDSKLSSENHLGSIRKIAY